MLVSLNWIRDFVDLGKVSNKEITDLITIRTAELDGIHQWGEFLKTAIVAEVISAELLPSQKASNVSLNIGANAPVTVVCAAKNVCAGMKSILAPVGSTLPDGRIVEAKELHGMVSNGFLCSEAELGLGSDNAGIIDLTSGAAGDKAASLFPDAVDTVIEIDNKSLTHRPDLWCHYGFAREIATIFNVPLKNRFTADWQKEVLAKCIKQESPMTPVVSADSCCLGYLCVSINDVTVVQSPAYMRHRLHRIGIRAINTAVDIGNYVMLELGIPLHLFDRDLIKGTKILIESLKKPTTVELLDDAKVELIAGDTVVADEAGPLVVGGIKGGKRSGVSNATTKLLLEVANWAAPAVRKTSLRIGVRTESSLRYEKSLDSQLIERTAVRALELILELSPEARIVGTLATAGIPPKGEPKKLSLSTSYVRKILGADVPEAEISRILTGLGFEVSGSGDKLEVAVPSYRATKDVTCDMDLIEEVGRMYGFENIPPESPEFKVLPVRLPGMKRLQRSISDLLVFGARAHEVMTYPMIGQDLLTRVQWPELNEKLTIKNALSVEADRMRPSVIPSALQAIVLNQKNYSSFRFFEIGRSYQAVEPFCQERDDLLIASFDKSDRTIVKTMEIVEDVLSLTHRNDISFVPLTEQAVGFVSPQWPGLMPTVNFQVQAAGQILGVVFEVSPEILRSLKVRGNVSLAVLSMPALMETALFDTRMFKPINYFPATSLDVTVVADDHMKVGEILSSVRKSAIEGLQKISVVSVFPLENEKKAVTLRAALQKATGTLTPEELKGFEQQIIGTLGEAGFPMRS